MMKLGAATAVSIILSTLLTSMTSKDIVSVMAVMLISLRP